MVYGSTGGAWQVLSGSIDTTDIGSAGDSYSNGGDYSYDIAGGSVDGTWQNSGNDQLNYDVSITSIVAKEGTWVMVPAP